MNKVGVARQQGDHDQGGMAEKLASPCPKCAGDLSVLRLLVGQTGGKRHFQRASANSDRKTGVWGSRDGYVREAKWQFLAIMQF